MITLELPLPTSTNKLYSTYYHYVFKNGKRIKVSAKRLSDEAVLFKNSVKKQLLNKNINISGRLKLTVILFPTRRGKFDLDNRLKVLQDSLTECNVFDDDSLIDELHVYRGEVYKKGLCIVKIEVLNSDKKLAFSYSLPDNYKNV